MSDSPRDRGGPWAVAGRRHVDLSWLPPIIAIALIGVTVIAIAGIWASTRLSLRAVDSDRTEAEQQGVTLAVALDDYAGIARLSDWVTTVEADLDTATAGSIRWTRVLDGVASTMPDGVGLMRFDGRADTGAVSVTVESTTYTALGDWLSRTSTTSGLADLSLISATRRPAVSSDVDVVEAIAKGRLALTSGPPSPSADSRETRQ